MKRLTPPRGLTALALGSVALAMLILFFAWPVRGGDLYMHLTVGQATWTHGWPPLTDIFSYTDPGKVFLAHSWLAGLAFYGADQLGGRLAFALLRWALMVTALACALFTSRLLGASWGHVVLVAPIVVWLAWGRLEFRPYLCGTLIMAAMLWLLISVHTGTRSRRWLWLLPGLMVLHINLHGGWPQSVMLMVVTLGAVVAMTLRHRWLGEGTTSQLPLWPLLAILAVSVAALWLNPWGTALVTFPPTMQESWIINYTKEWQTPWLNLGWGEVGGGTIVPVQPVFFAYMAVVAVLLIRAARRWKTADLIPPAVMTLWLALGLWQLRSTGDAVLLTSPFVAAALPSWRGRWPLVVGSLGLVAMSLVAAHHLVQTRHTDPMHVWNVGHPDGPPEYLAEVIQRRGLTDARVWSPIDKWLLYRFPGMRVAHTWEFHHGHRRYSMMEAGGDLDRLQAHLQRYQVNLLVGLMPGYAPVVDRLTPLGWRVAYQDARWLLLAR